jgi:hypothetical protein
VGKNLIRIALVLASLTCAAEETEPEIFQPVESHWLVESVFEFPFYSFYLGAPAIRGLAYLPNFAPRVGARVIYKGVGSTMTLSLPIPKSEVERRGDSSTSSIILNSYWRQYAYDIYYQRYRGFYAASPFTELSTHKPARYPQLPGAQVLNYGGNAYILFRPDGYSLKAAFDLSEYQTRTGGSWLLNPFYNHLEMTVPGRFVPGSDSNPQPPNLGAGRFDTAGAGFGYGYMYVYQHFFATGQVAYGPGIQFQRIKRTDGDDSNVWSLAAKLNVNLSVGENFPVYVGGVKFLADSIWAKVLNTQVSSTLVSVQFFFGRRF